MAVFTIQAPDGRRIKIEAADEATAIRGAQEWSAANPKQATFTAENAGAGMLSPGNLDLNARKVYHGTSRDTPFKDYRTENSMSIGTDKGEVLIPTVVGGRQLTPEQAIAHFQQTGENLGMFASPAAADTYAEQLHQRQQAKYGPRVAITELQGRVADLPSRQAPPAPRPDLLSSTLATVNGISASVPFLQNITDATIGGVSQLVGGESAKDYIARQRAYRDSIAQQAPVARVAGELGGLVASTGALGATKLGAQALGLEGNLGQRALNSSLSSGGLTVADAMSRGEDVGETLKQGGAGALIGLALPVGGAVIRAGGRAVRDNLIRPISTLAKRENEVTKRLSTAVQQDIGTGQRMTQGMEQTAAQAGAPVINADRFGSAIRTLSRAASNVSPEADNILRGVTDQRFLTQANRAQGFLRGLMGGAVDDLALQDALQAAAQKTNKAAYDAAYSSPKGRAVWTPEIRGLMEATPFRNAVDAAEEVSTNAAAVSGGKPVRNPFVFPNPNSAEGVTLRQMPDGSYAMPNLEFWDIVQRNLRRQSEMAYKGGDNLLGGQIRDMRNQLNTILDTAVPQFKKARRGAAGFFGAEDAIEAGRKAAKGTRNVPEVERAVKAMPKAEQEAFSVGYVSELIDNLGAVRDRTNAIEAVFGRPESRQRIAAALGPVRAKQLEAYVRMEQALDLLRGAVGGNSTTAKQLIAAGVMGGGGGYLLSGGDLGQTANWAMLAGFGRRGLQMLGKRVDEQVMKEVAEVLASGDPKRLERAIAQAAIDKRHMDAIHAIMRGLAGASRGAAIGAVGGDSNYSPPPTLNITVRGGAPAM